MNGDASVRPEAGRRAPSVRVRVLVTLACFVGGLLLLEAAMRFLLFHPSELARSWGATLRNPRRYFDTKGSYVVPTPQDPELGWLSHEIDPLTYRHIDAGSVGTRRPVLLFGSSFVYPLDPDLPDHTELLEASELGRDHRLLNYSVKNYGLGQICLLLERSFEHHAAARPIVIVAIMVNTVIDRADMSLRQGPKPRVVPDEHGEFDVVYPDTLDVAEFIERHPPEITSYAWNHLLIGMDVVPEGIRNRLLGLPEVERRRREILAACLRKVKATLDGRCDYFLLGLFPEKSIAAVDDDWRRTLWQELARELEIPTVSMLPMLLRDVETTGASVGDFYLVDNGHPNQRGIELIQAAIQRGVRGEYDEP